MSSANGPPGGPPDRKADSDTGSRPRITKTEVDLGDDLLESTGESDRLSSPSVPAEEPLRAGESIADQLHSAQILINENLIEEAKRVLRQVLITDPGNVSARKLLAQLHEQELKQIFRMDADGIVQGPVRRPLPGLQSLPPPVDPAVVLQQLERDLGLGLDDEPVFEGSAEPGFSLFENREAMDAFAAKLDRDLAEATWRDRLDIGIAFLEMGLYDLAARQFRLVANEPAEMTVATSLLAYTLILSGKAFEAAMVIEPVLRDAELDPEVKIEFIYLMGRAQEAQNHLEEALTWYFQVAEIDRFYRDVGSRIRNVSTLPRNKVEPDS